MSNTNGMAIRSWSVDITLAERDGHTHARARLHTADATALLATGTAADDIEGVTHAAATAA